MDDPVPDEAVAQAARELRIAVARLHRKMRLVANEGALSASQVSVLARIAKGEADTAAALATLDGVRPQSMAATVGALEQFGLIGRFPDPQDGRRTILRLTEAGETTFAGNRAARQEWLERTLRERLDADEIEAVRAAMTLLQRLTDR